MKYKVGDEVLVKGAIMDVHEGTDNPYYVASDYSCINWVSVDKIIPADKTYSQGLADAWELAKKICYEPKKGGFSNIELMEIFGTAIIEGIYDRFTVEEALAKISEYEREKEIKVGDVVERNGFKGVVLHIFHSGSLNIVYENGIIETLASVQECKKTGKHIDIEGLLKQIGE